MEEGGADRLVARFDWFEYTGEDEVFDVALTDDEYLNPILTGFYPDPSVVRVGGDYYMTHSTFGFYPGLPVFHSTDLVHWTQIGNAVDRPDMMSFDGMHLGWRGLYAPTIEYHEGLFHIINTCVECGGDFILTARDPAGPWSDPIWVGEAADLRGIDPQMFFEDGRLYIVNHEDPAGPKLYDGHKAIWIREVDPATYEIVGEKRMIVDGGVDHVVAQPGWVEGPHLYEVDGLYYLSAAEGGTGMDHRQTIYRASDVWGPYVPWEKNPSLTQRDLPPERPHPITSTGHADLVETQNGDWWAVFLGTRTFDTIHFVTGRETFLLPVTWTEDGWPLILEPGREVPWVLERPDLPRSAAPARPIAGNFTVRDEFDGELASYWMFARIPRETWWSTGDGELVVTARDERLGDGTQPSIVGRRLHHMSSRVTAPVAFEPRGPGDEAGLMLFQNDSFYYAFGIGRTEAGETVLRLRRRDGDQVPVGGHVVREQAFGVGELRAVVLRADLRGAEVSFSYSLDGEEFEEFVSGEDARILGTMRAGGFTGAFAGMYAETGEARPNREDPSSVG